MLGALVVLSAFASEIDGNALVTIDSGGRVVVGRGGRLTVGLSNSARAGVPDHQYE